MTRDAGDGPERRGGAPFDPASYGEMLGASYDTLYPADGLDTDACVTFLAELARRDSAGSSAGSVLEFGIGSGRLALELHRRGIRVAGIDASPAMIERLRDRDPDGHIYVALGDFACTRIGGQFAVVALVFNTILDERGLPSQLGTFENAARHLPPGGFFVVEAFVLSDAARDGRWTVSPRYVGADHVELQMARFDIETGIVERTLVHLLPDGAQFVTVKDVYAGPGELDVMAHVHGMRRIERYASWTREPFTAHSPRHISVYQRI
jgi:SAM-dependent methyltransferase